MGKWETPRRTKVFMSRVQKTNTCWIWTGGRNKKNYGRFGQEPAHRVSYELFRGPVDRSLFVLHSCDNPPCVNPDHLSLGTAADNAKDRSVRGRQRKKYTMEQVREIRKLWDLGGSYSQIRKKTGMSEGNINKIVKYKTRNFT